MNLFKTIKYNKLVTPSRARSHATTQTPTGFTQTTKSKRISNNCREHIESFSNKTDYCHQSTTTASNLEVFPIPRIHLLDRTARSKKWRMRKSPYNSGKEVRGLHTQSAGEAALPEPKGHSQRQPETDSTDLRHLGSQDGGAHKVSLVSHKTWGTSAMKPLIRDPRASGTVLGWVQNQRVTKVETTKAPWGPGPS